MRDNELKMSNVCFFWVRWILVGDPRLTVLKDLSVKRMLSLEKCKCFLIPGHSTCSREVFCLHSVCLLGIWIYQALIRNGQLISYKNPFQVVIGGGYLHHTSWCLWGDAKLLLRCKEIETKRIATTTTTIILITKIIYYFI